MAGRTGVVPEGASLVSATAGASGSRSAIPSSDKLADDLLAVLIKLYAHGHGPGVPRHTPGALTNVQHSLLEILAEQGPMRITDLAHAHGVAVPTMSVAVDRLIRDGLVRRSALRADRVSLIYVTRRGGAAYRSSVVARQLGTQQALGALDDADRTALRSAVGVLSRLLGDYAPVTS